MADYPRIIAPERNNGSRFARVIMQGPGDYVVQTTNARYSVRYGTQSQHFGKGARKAAMLSYTKYLSIKG